VLIERWVSLGHILQAAKSHGDQEGGDARSAEEGGRKTHARGDGAPRGTRAELMSCESFHESDEIDREWLSLYDTDL